MTAAWDAYLHARFPAYLLPESAARALSAEEAARFLEAITGRSDQLTLLRAVSLLSRRVAELQTLSDALEDLARRLPSRTEGERRRWQGTFQGRLDLKATLALHMAGRRTEFVTAARRRSFDLPENVLVRGVVERLRGVLAHLRAADLLKESGWTGGLSEVDSVLLRLGSASALKHVAMSPLTAEHENAARTAGHHAYHLAAEWAAWLRDALDEQDPGRIARMVAEGALLPLPDSTRFELAALLRLAEALERSVLTREPARWRMERAAVIAGRREVLALNRDDGVTLRVFYNQAELPGGAVERGVGHYLASFGRMRPDVTVTVSKGSVRRGAVVVECKLSEDAGYVVGGYHEAALYRWEYADHLLPWPRAVLVTSGAVPGAVRRNDDVIAVTWDAWPPVEVVEAIIDASVAC